jgi:NADH:ubiquinone oxidoreductase subunit 4 (subunit M)
LGRNDRYKGLPDLDTREFAIAVPLVVFTVLLGVAPQMTVLEWMGPSVTQMVAKVARPILAQQGVPQQAASSPEVRQR